MVNFTFMAQLLALHKENRNKMKTLVNLAFILGLAFIVYRFTGADNTDEQFKRNYDISYFNEMELRGPFKVILTQGTTPQLDIKASEKIHDEIEVYVENDRLIIELKDKIFSKSKSIKLYVTVKDLEKLIITGAVDLETENIIHTEDLKIEFEGAGQVNLDLETDRVIAEIDGVGSFWLQGNANYHKVEFSGVGSYEAKNLICKNTIVESDGVGNVEVFASNKFIGHANGIGSVTYYGNPDDVSIDSSGIGKVHSK